MVLFKFIKHPEYLKVGAKVLFREGATKGIGHVTKLQPIAHFPASQLEDQEAWFDCFGLFFVSHGLKKT